MQHKNIPYNYREWTASNGQKCSSYTCKYFNFYPYHLISFPADTEQEMKDSLAYICLHSNDNTPFLFLI